MSASHGAPLRGLSSASRSPMFEGRFGHMFPWLHPAVYGKTDSETVANLELLGGKMEATKDILDPKDGRDEEESGIPSLYTYLGQFVDHDLTFGPEGSFQKQRDVEALVDFRTPAFDLDCVYGRGPGDQPYMYDSKERFLLGSPIGGGSDPNARDLARNTADPARALIGDPRNDENVLVSQLQGLFLRFHNRLMDEGSTFKQAQRELQFHYQYMLLNDFLPSIVDAGVLNSLKTGHRFDVHNIRFYRPKTYPFMPIEYSTAAYRFGHSMIRPGYRLNDKNILGIFGADQDHDLRGKHAMDPTRGLDWGRFVDTDIRPYDGDPGTVEQKGRLQFAYKIDTSLVNPLAGLPPNVVDPTNPPLSLGQRNLVRSFDFGLPSGQAVARAMGVPLLDDDKILIGKATCVAGDTQSIAKISDDLKTDVFRGNCPLWTYLLAEAMQFPASVKIPATGVPGDGKISTPRLGPVGGRIVAEVFLGIMYADKTSLLSSNPAWTPATGADYRLRDFVLYAIGKSAVRAAGR